MNYRKMNNLLGWITGAIAYIVYLLTMERTVSFWDCGEFGSVAYKMEVGHSPGAPFFMMMQRLFSLFSGSGALTGQPSTTAIIFINSLSALVSALTILFLFWTITHIAKKLTSSNEDAEPDMVQKTIIMGAGLVGALAYTFSDTFWFSAVEAEVYATSSFFTALVFWAILKWESVADNKYADRWLIFIAYMMGLSVGIHLLNLLTIPALAMVYYFKRFTPTVSGGIIAFIVGAAILGFVQFGILQGLPALAFQFDYLFVNSFGLPMDSGALFFLALFVGLLIWLLFFARKKGYYLLHSGVLCIVFVVIGFSSYLVPVIRSRADVAIDMTNPDNADRLLSYVNREQFGQQPLIYGPDFTSPVVGYDTSSKLYYAMERDGKKVYEIVGSKVKPEFDNKRFFPRIWDNNDQSHAQFYRSYLGLEADEDPTAADNMSFFFGYQLNWMWWRYFMWNYVGRQNDVEGQGDSRSGNWLSGIKPIDKMFGRGDVDKMGDGFANNGARNELYFLPFILGIIGMVFHFNTHRRDALIVALLFFFTGIAVVLYLNNTPIQPRERDYAYAGATYAFAIWIGLGVLAIHQWIKNSVKGSGGAALVTIVCLVAVPLLMAAKEWDDHDRSKKTLGLESARNTLESCAPNALLFTFGDNDTYPLWYIQEMEGVRTDVRVINMSLLGIDWYIDQLNYKINDADAVPMVWTKDKYVGDRRNYVFYNENPVIPKNKFVNLYEACTFMNGDDQASQLQTRNGWMNYMPSKNFAVDGLSKDDLVKNGFVKAEDTAKINTNMAFTFVKDAAYKDDLAVLNIVAAISKQGWKRPIYFSGGLGSDNYQGMQDYLKLEGIVYRLVPYKYNPDPLDPQGPRNEMGFIDVDKSMDLFLKYKFGGAETGDVYFDEKNRIMFTAYRNNAPRIAEELAKRGREADAEKVMDAIDTKITQKAYPYNPYIINVGFEPSAYFMATGYYNIGTETASKKGAAVAMKMAKNLEADVNWILTLRRSSKEVMSDDVQRDCDITMRLAYLAISNKDMVTGKQLLTMLAGLKNKVDKDDAFGPGLLQQLSQQLPQLEVMMQQPQPVAPETPTVKTVDSGK